MRKKERAAAAVKLLSELYPNAVCSLEYQDAFQLLIATRLSAQCTDKRVNMVTPALFKEFPTAQSMANADIARVEELIKTCGLYKTKAKDLVGIAKQITERFGGRVPDNMDELLMLPGVGRKTANLILGDLYRVPGSVVVDTHCIRISNRLGLVDDLKDPAKIEAELRRQLPPEKSSDFCHRLVLHGRAVCTARKPACSSCCLRTCCRSGDALLP